MRHRSIALMILFVLPTGCQGSDQHLKKLAQEVYSQKNWESPLPPYEFASDGCSCWPDYKWVVCCVEHDATYWMGGTKEERKQADIALAECVSHKGYPIVGKIMYYGVRLEGVYWLPTPFRWGFGWRYPQSGPPNKPY
jgi:hypothetical protein